MSGTALVTGARGFTGGHLVEQLTDAGWDVLATDLDEGEREAFYTETGNAPHPVYSADSRNQTATFVAADLTDRASLEPLFEGREVDVAFHVASLFDYFAEWPALKAVNMDGARNIAEVAAAAGVDHFVHVSTLGVLGDAGFDSPKTEADPYDPHNQYCESKRQQEEILSEIADSTGLSLTIVRAAPIYGPGNRYGVYHIPLVIAKVGVAPIFRIYPRSRQLVFPSIHVDDLCGILQFVHRHRERTRGETYHAVSDCIPQDELIEFVGEAVNARRVRIPLPYAGYRAASAYAVWHSRRIQRIARKRDRRPKIDAPITKYLSKNMWFSNQKIRELGYEFEYRDPRAGLWAYLTWCKERGLLP